MWRTTLNASEYITSILNGCHLNKFFNLFQTPIRTGLYTILLYISLLLLLLNQVT